MSRSTEQKERKKMEKMLSQIQGSLSLDLVYAEYLVFLKGIPKGGIGTLGLGEDVWRIQCQELLVVFPRANQSLAGYIVLWKLAKK